MTFRQDYMRGLDAIYEYAPYFYRIMLFMGIPSANDNIPTAQVSYDPRNKEVLFEINPSLIENLSDEEIGFIISHEAYHVILRHLHEAMDTKEYPDDQSLLLAHEAIINDTVSGVLGLDSPDMNLVFGKQFGSDFSAFSTREAYDWIHEDSENNSNSNSESSDSSPDKESAGSSSGGTGDSDSDSNDSSGTQSNGGYQTCGGVVVPEGFENEFANAVAGGLKDAIKDISDNGEDVPTEIIDSLDELSNDSNVDITGGYGISSNTETMFVGSDDNMNLDWKMLISQFNPKILSSGGVKYRDSWTSLNRRMTSVYPRVIMPNRIRKKDAGSKGDDTPTFILALDMSYSIPTRLINGLANLAETIPDKFVKVMPITWSEYTLEFDTTTKNIVSRSGTNIDGVWDYSQKVKKKIGKEPYVFVITDGECFFNDYYYSRNRGIVVDDSVVQNNWYWGAIDSKSIHAINSNMSEQVDKDKVYLVDDFLV